MSAQRLIVIESAFKLKAGGQIDFEGGTITLAGRGLRRVLEAAGVVVRGVVFDAHDRPEVHGGSGDLEARDLTAHHVVAE